MGTSDDDGDSWDTVWRFSDFEAARPSNGPLECPAGTIQHDTCDDGSTPWRMLFCDTFMFEFEECAVPEPDAGPVGGARCKSTGGHLGVLVHGGANRENLRLIHGGIGLSYRRE